MPLYIGHSDNLINKTAAYGFVVYNPRDEQIATSHAMDLLQYSAEHLARRRSYRKYFWFDWAYRTRAAAQRLFPGQLVTGYDVSRDDRVVAAVLERDGKSGVWVAWLDGREPPRRIPRADGDNPRFGRDGEIVFRAIEGNAGVLYRIRENGERREKITDLAGTVFGMVSPDGEWLSGVARGLG